VGNYTFKIQTANLVDNFNKLTNSQIDFLIGTYDIKDAVKESNQIKVCESGLNKGKLCNLDSDCGAGISCTTNASWDKYAFARSLIFAAYVNNQFKGYFWVPNTDANSQVQEGKINIGPLQPGIQEIELRFLNDYNVDFSSAWAAGTCQGPHAHGQGCSMTDTATNVCQSNSTCQNITSKCSNADQPCAVDADCPTGSKCISSGTCQDGLNKDKVCKTDNDCPFLADVCVSNLPAYLKVFQNADLDQNKILDANPVIFTAAIAKVVPVNDIIGIRIYSNNQNKYPAVWYQDNVINPSAGLETITVDGYQAVRDGRTVYVAAANVASDKVYTNIYVLAYNENAAPATQEIYKSMLDNFNFNTNLQNLYPADYALKKDQLRRDTIRRADINHINNLLAAYRQKNGKFPALAVGTFVPGHSLSTWPSWQATLGNALGSSLPIDPLNYLATSISQNDCSGNKAASDNCKNICTRDTSGNPLTGCPANQQCVQDKYCSISPAGYDPLTGWDQTKLKFAFNTYTTENCSNKALIGAFNLGGSMPCAYDGAFVYQYTTTDSGKTYLLNYRLEYQTKETCQPGQCFVNNQCYNSGQCINPSDHSYCLAGSTLNSCGDGFLQSDCGEECDGKLGTSNLCTDSFGNHNFYTLVSGTCSSDCKIQSQTNLTPADCGGYCGDGTIQKEYGETCDSGITDINAPGFVNPAYCVNCRCVPNCKGKCGGAPDGCGGKCTSGCGTGQVCNNGVCITCANAGVCTGKCGIVGSCDCGVCVDPNQKCVNNKCVDIPITPACTPNCAGKVCGPDGCGNANGCGICGIGKKCNEATGKCVLDCASTCLPYNLSSKIYPCGYDGCGNQYGCYYFNGKYNTTNSAVDCSIYGLTGSAWTCNPLLGRCTCELAPTDPRSCLDRCAGYDGCGKACTFDCTAKGGPCNTNGTLSEGNPKKEALANRCLTCSDYCQVWAGEGNSSDCYDYKIVTLDRPTPLDDYPVVVCVPDNLIKNFGYYINDKLAGYDPSIRFLDVNSRTTFYDFYVDGTNRTYQSGYSWDPTHTDTCGTGTTKFWVKVPKAGTTKFYLIYANNKNNLSRLPKTNNPNHPVNVPEYVFDIWDDFDGDYPPGMSFDTYWGFLATKYSEGAPSVDNTNGEIHIHGYLNRSALAYDLFGVESNKDFSRNHLFRVKMRYDISTRYGGANYWKAYTGNYQLAIKGESGSFARRVWNGSNWVYKNWSYVNECNTNGDFVIYQVLDKGGLLNQESCFNGDKNSGICWTTYYKDASAGPVELLWGQDTSGGSQEEEKSMTFDVGFDNVLLRKYVSPEPVATINEPTDAPCPACPRKSKDEVCAGRCGGALVSNGCNGTITCDNLCSGGQICDTTTGICVNPCTPNKEIACAGRCGNVSVPDGCGGTITCDTTCPAGNNCDTSTGNCVSVCVPKTKDTACAGRCGNVEVPDGCGGIITCGTTCPAGQTCNTDEGFCECPSGQKICGTQCIPSANCCTDAECGSGKTCVSGSCQ
jgi:hypothetical protein